MDFKNTLLWKRGLGEQSGDNEAEAQARTKLREAYLQMRDNAAELVSSIPDDCKGLTVHDITHLDALWDVADTIVGPDYALTPIRIEQIRVDSFKSLLNALERVWGRYHPELLVQNIQLSTATFLDERSDAWVLSIGKDATPNKED